MNRTREFGDIVNHVVPKSKPRAPPTTRSAFNEAASEIGRGIHSTSQTLTKLTKLVRSQGLFNDPTEEINNLIFSIKQDLDELNNKCDNAQQYVDSHRNAVSKAKGQSSHHSSVVGSLKHGLANTAQSFKSILEVRSNRMKDNVIRKKALTGGGLLSPMHQNQNLGIGMPQGGTGSNNNMGKHDNRKIGGGFEDTGAIATPYDTLRQRQTPSTPSANKDSMFMNNNPYNSNNPYNAHVEEGGETAIDIFNMSPQQVAQQEQMLLLAPPTQYHDERVKAADEIESTIGELGTLFKRLTSMIHEQQELVERIDEDVENAVVTVDNAHDQLKQAYDSASSNRALYTKVGAILIIFFLFFTVFMM